MKKKWICETCCNEIIEAKDGWVEGRLHCSQILSLNLYHRERGCLPSGQHVAWSCHLSRLQGRTGLRMIQQVVDDGYMSWFVADRLKEKLNLDGYSSAR
jgi:hypothetical protein